MNTPMDPVKDIETRLNDFDPTVRMEALQDLRSGLDAGLITTPLPEPLCNLHVHTFFSYNAFGYSPSFLAWLAKREGILIMGIVDFDTIAGVEEFLAACEILEQRGTASMETRVFLPEFSHLVINSPNEPGVVYYMICGIPSGEIPADAYAIFEDLQDRSSMRNQRIVAILNQHLFPLQVNYDEDVLPLSAGHTPTERHILSAYLVQEEQVLKDPVAFWSQKLEQKPDVIRTLRTEPPKFKGVIRRKLIKTGGVAYQQPDEHSFQSLENIHTLSNHCSALPTLSWLDGTNAGEQREPELLHYLIPKGLRCFNIIPDRNWHFDDREERERKVQNLYDVVTLVEGMDLPIIVGTEMNRPGQKWVDDFEATALVPLRQTFMTGAFFLYGHTMLARHAGIGVGSEWAREHLPRRREKNRFYAAAGKLIKPTAAFRRGLGSLPVNPSPKKILSLLASLQDQK